MSITITTLNNELAVAKTFTLLGRDRTTAEYRNDSDSTTSLEGLLTIKQQVIGNTKTGIKIRRSLVQSKFIAPTTVVINGNSVTVPEEIVVNLTITTPVGLATLTAALRKDLVAFVRNLVTAANVEKLANGEN